MARYLLVSSPIGGHVAPIRAVGAALVQRGHRVRALTGSRFRPHIEREGMTFLPLPPKADYDDADLNGSFPGRAGLGGARAVRFDMSNLFVKPMSHQYRAITEALDEEPVDGIVAELTTTGLLPLLLSGKARPPIHVLGCTPLPVTSRDTFPYGLGLEPPASALGKLRARLTTQVAKRVVLGQVQREIDTLLDCLGLPASPVFFLEWFTLAERFWQLSVPGFEYPRSDLAPNIGFAGPILPDAGGDLPDWWDDLDGTRPVIHVTQGTIDNHDLSMLIGSTITGLAHKDLLVVATTGGRPISDIPVALPANVRVAEFIPYHLLLPKVDVMVTNGGYGGVQFALVHGVPLVVAGEREDKPDIAARVAWSGIGLNLNTGRPAPASVAAAVTDLLNQTTYRDAATELAAQADGYDALTTIIAEVENPHQVHRQPRGPAEGADMAKERSISASVIIQAPPERVWEVLCDTTRYAEWVESTLRVVRSDGPARLDATYEELTRISGPWKTLTRWRVTEFDRPRRQVHAGEGVVTAHGMTLVLELTPTGENTHFTSTIRYTPRFGVIGTVIDRATEGPLTRAQQRSAHMFAALIARERSRP